ncbi:MAG: hypothetical protein CBC35_08360 [Planctomycetes bacterium TMED75]|nr:hypothetical protein [Planctomycetaceae bacterium]OUU92003.1 MAG: hypothetical protein CBC35_08360 [Planctomycetes bacterium TMED75]
MKSGVADPKNLTKLIKKIGKRDSVPAAGGHGADDDPILVLIFSFLLWEATTKQALDGMKKLMAATVDFNELRVCLPNEIAALLGVRYPLALERSQRLKLTLQSIYLKHHAVSLDQLREKGKREAKAFMEDLHGITPYVSARVLQRCFGVHQIPVDDRLVDLMIEAKVLSEVVDSGACSSWLSRQVKSQNGLEVADGLRAFVDDAPKPARRSTPRPIVLAYRVPEVEEDAEQANNASNQTGASTPAAKASAKEPVSKKASSKKAPPKKAEPKKTASKKVPVKKVAKKAVSKKTVTKKSTKKTTKKAAKKTAKKKVGSRKSSTR